MKRLKCMSVLLVWVMMVACSNPDYPGIDRTNEYQRFTEMYFDVFDTITILVGYAKSQEEFDYFSNEIIKEELHRLHQLFDRFTEYEGINNIYTINNYAGIAPVEVDPAIIEMLLLAVEAYEISGGLVNVAIGPVTDIWRDAMTSKTVPNMEDLLLAKENSNINHLIINEEMSTVFLQHEAMSLDVGSIAKGFAVELATQKAITAGFDSFSLSVGGDVRVGERPPSNQDAWSIGIANPEGGDVLDVVLTTNMSVFSSGDYLRYVEVDGQRFHHIIDPRTLMPTAHHRSMTVVYPDGAMADIFSLAAFIMDSRDAKEFLESFGAQGLWMEQDGTIGFTYNWGE